MPSSPHSGRRNAMTALKTAFQKVSSSVSPSSSRRGSLQPQSSPGSAANSAPTSPFLTQRQKPEATGHEWQESHPGTLVYTPPSRPVGPVTAPTITCPHDVRGRKARHHSLHDISHALAFLDPDHEKCDSPQSPTDPVQSNESGRTNGPPSDNPIDVLMSLASKFAPTLSGESWTERDLESALLFWDTPDVNEDWRDEKWSKLRSVLDKVAETTDDPDVASAVRHIQDRMNPPRPILEPGPSDYTGATYYRTPGLGAGQGQDYDTL